MTEHDAAQMVATTADAQRSRDTAKLISGWQPADAHGGQNRTRGTVCAPSLGRLDPE
jgi:hypothetical protein